MKCAKPVREYNDNPCIKSIRRIHKVYPQRALPLIPGVKQCESMSLIIRNATSSDLKDISSLLLQLGYNPSIDQINELIQRSNVTSNSEIFVAEHSDSIVGLMALIYFDYFPTSQKICRITALVVKASKRSRGIGTKLIRFAQAEGLKEHCAGIEITTATGREGTHVYYKNLGFAKTSFRFYKSIERDV